MGDGDQESEGPYARCARAPQLVAAASRITEGIAKGIFTAAANTDIQGARVPVVTILLTSGLTRPALTLIVHRAGIPVAATSTIVREHTATARVTTVIRA